MVNARREAVDAERPLRRSKSTGRGGKASYGRSGGRRRPIHQPHEAACRIKWVTGHEPLTPALDDVVLVTPPNGVTGRTDAEYGAGTCHP